jgi:hypothetical protein
MKQSMRSLTHPKTRAAAAGLLALAALGGAVGQLDAAGASAPDSANLGVRQVVSNGAAADQTVITDHVHNAGPATATNVDIVALVKTNGALFYSVNSGICQEEAAPPGWTYMFTCQGPSISSGGSWEPKATITGTRGKTLTVFLSAGAHGPADPSLVNNSSTLKTYVGSEADLGLSQKATAGKSARDAIVTVTIRNHGPWTASSLQYVGEIKSAGYRSVEASGPDGGSCQFIPAAAGFTKAFACTFAALLPGKTWIAHLAFTGKAKGKLVVKGSVSANSPGDPISRNNNASSSTHYKA